MAGFANVLARADVGGAGIPEPIVQEIIQELPKQSVLLERARKVRMTSKTSRQPVLASLPEAEWVNGDSAQKQTTDVTWDQVTMTAEELAILVPIPDAVIDDSSIPIWSEIRPLLVEAIGKKVDQAGIFGTGKPASWPTAIIPGAIAAGNVVQRSALHDLADNVAELGEKIADDGFGINGFASQPGFNWALARLRDANGQPIYTPSLAQGVPATLYGLPLNEVMNGSWNRAVASLLAADWTKFAVGIRQDITFKMFDQGTINDADGKVIYNAMQQDGQIMRVVFRVGFAVANPLTRVNPTNSTRYPAGVITPAA